MARPKKTFTTEVPTTTEPVRNQAAVKQEYVNLCARLGDIDYQITTVLPQEKTTIYQKLSTLNEEFKTLPPATT